MRKTLQSCKSRNFHFPNDIPEKRVISYTKIGENESIQVYLNCEEYDVNIDISGFAEIVYSRKWSDITPGNGILGPNGILIVRGLPV